MYKKMKKYSLIISLSFLLFACNNNKMGENSATSSSEIAIDGSSTVYPLSEAVAEEFRNVQPDVEVTIGVSGTGGGFQKFGRGEIDIANASRPIKNEEKTIAAANNIEPLELKIAFDGLAVVIHPSNDWITSITVEELKRIWEPAAQGKIMKWNQINPQWPNEEIHLYGPGVASGTFDYFTEAIVGSSGASRGDFTASEDDNVLVQGVAGDKFGLGFFGFAYYEENSDKLGLVGVDSGNGPVKPSLETIRDGSYTPLSRPLLIYVNSSSLKKPAVRDFLEFYLQEAAELSKDVGYFPLPAEDYTNQRKILDSFVETYNVQ